MEKANEITHKFKSLSYQSSFIYDFLTRRLYDQRKKFMSIAKIIGNSSKKVLDLPCGTGGLTNYLHPSTTYTGFDLNAHFLKKIRKRWLKGKINLKRVRLKQIDIFDYKEYPNEMQDVIVFCDILHHVYPNHIELIENAKNFAKMIIICEPKVVRPKDNMRAFDVLGKCIVKIGKVFPPRLMKIIDLLFADNDGINSFEERSLWKYDDKSLRELYIKMGFTKIYKMMDEYIGVWIIK